ncbi:MAG: alpha/beta fold hydrolase [Bacteroidota bacterium]
MVQNDPNATGRYASINGLNLYYEVHGSGKPLVLLHGGVSASEAFGPNIKRLAETRQVIAVHMQGHGHTRDIDRPLRFESMADDVAALIDHLDIERADVLGYSMGGNAALQTAIRHPGKVGKLVVVSAPMKHEGWYPEVLLNFEQMASVAPQLGQGLKRSPLAQMYPDVDWEMLFTRIGEMESQDYDWSTDVTALQMPVMIMFADADSVRLEHILDFYRLLGGGLHDAGLDGSARPKARLAIVPGTTHYDILSTEVVAELVAPFLDAA